jgi:hypothetical protein
MANEHYAPGRLIPLGVLQRHYDQANKGDVPTIAEFAATFSDTQRADFEAISGLPARDALRAECAVAGLALAD